MILEGKLLHELKNKNHSKNDLQFSMSRADICIHCEKSENYVYLPIHEHVCSSKYFPALNKI